MQFLIVAVCNGAVVMNLIKVFSSPEQMLCGCGRSLCRCVWKIAPSYVRCDLWPFRATPTSVGSCNPSSLIGLRRSVGYGVACWVDRD